jgi:ATP-dependent RNA helicase DbpA
METYVHRIGRTGRAGNTGHAFTLAMPGEQHKIEAARAFLKLDVPAESLEWADKDSFGVLLAEKVTLCISAGRKDKLRAGDILGALTGEKGLPGKAVGKIDVLDYEAYVSVDRKAADKAFDRLSGNKIKGQKFKVRMLG